MSVWGTHSCSAILSRSPGKGRFTTISPRTSGATKPVYRVGSRDEDDTDFVEEVLTVSAEAPARTTRAVRFPVRLEPRRTRAGGNARKHAWGAAAAMTRARYCPRKQKRTTRILRPDNQEITRDEYLLRRFEQTSRRHPARGSVSRPPPLARTESVARSRGRARWRVRTPRRPPRPVPLCRRADVAVM